MTTSDNQPQRSLVSRGRELALTLLDVVPGAQRFLLEIKRVEFIDKSLVIAAQALFSITPLLVVLAAFMPHGVTADLIDEVSDVMGFGNNDTVTVDTAATAEHVRTQTGFIGVLLVIVSALSFARAFQRLYEKIWEKPHRGGFVGVRRCLLWLVAFIVYLQLLAWAIGTMRGADFAVLRAILQVVIGAGLWWWTAHTLLLGRVPWRSLWLGAVITAVALNAMSRISRVVMPSYVHANVDQFGGIGLMLAASTWLLCFGGVIVIASILGRVLVEEPRLSPAAMRSWFRLHR